MNPDRKYDEALLVQQLSHGDEAALKSLYDTYYVRLVYFGDHLIHNTSQAEDFVITAFTRYWDKRENFSSINQIASYLYTTIKHDCFKYYRQQHLKGDFTEEQLAAPDDNYAESRIVLSETLEYIHRQIEELSPHYREVIRLLFLEEMSISETAEKLGITPEAVRKRKERALEQLRNKILIDRIHPLSFLLLVLMKNMN